MCRKSKVPEKEGAVFVLQSWISLLVQNAGKDHILSNKAKDDKEKDRQLLAGLFTFLRCDVSGG